MFLSSSHNPNRSTPKPHAIFHFDTMHKGRCLPNKKIGNWIRAVFFITIFSVNRSRNLPLQEDNISSILHISFFLKLHQFNLMTESKAEESDSLWITLHKMINGSGNMQFWLHFRGISGIFFSIFRYRYIPNTFQR